MAGADVVIDAADSFAVTYVLSDACRAAARPLVSASVVGLTGYVGVFCGAAPSYRAVFPDMPRAAGSCAESGVLGTAVGTLGSLQAHLTLALLLDWQPPVSGRLLSIDFRTLHLGGFSFAGAQEAEAGRRSRSSRRRRCASTIWSSTCAASPRRRCRRSPARCASRCRHSSSTQVTLPEARRIVLCCRSGVRAWRAARALQRQGHANLALIALGE